MQIHLLNKWTTRSSTGVISKGIYMIDGVRYYVKGNTVDNNEEKGYEPFSEVMAYQIGVALGYDVVPTVLASAYDFPDILTTGIQYVSCARDFMQPGESWTPMYLMLQAWGYSLDYLTSTDLLAVLADRGFLQQFMPMFWFDALVGNEDRHLGNFGFITNEAGVTRAHPIFDNGGCLFGMMGRSQLKVANILSYDKAKPFASTHREQLAMLGIPWPAVDTQTVLNVIEPTLQLMPDVQRAQLIRQYIISRTTR